MNVAAVWESGNPSIATVSPAGMVTAVGLGTTTITASAAAGAAWLSTTATVTVTALPPGAGYQLAAVLPPSPYIGGWLTLMGSTHQHFNVQIARTTGFTGTVTLEAQGVPGGITVSFSPAATTGTVVEATVTAGDSAPEGEYQIFVRGLADGLASRSLPVPIIVVGPEGDDFVLSANPAAITVARGASATTTIEVTRTAAFANGWVGLGAWYAPPGMSTEFSPASGNQFATSALTLRAAQSLAAGTYDVLVWGVFDVYGDVRWTHVHVTVIDPPGAPGR
jgi:hypothetical protein